MPTFGERAQVPSRLPRRLRMLRMMAGAESCPRIAHEDEGEIRRTRQARVAWPPNVAGSNRHRSDAECRLCEACSCLLARIAMARFRTGGRDGPSFHIWKMQQGTCFSASAACNSGQRCAEVEREGEGAPTGPAPGRPEVMFAQVRRVQMSRIVLELTCGRRRATRGWTQSQLICRI